MPVRRTLDNMSRLRKWLFLYATRIVEFVNAMFIMAFSIAFLIDLADGTMSMYAMPSYSDFKSAGGLGWLFFLGLGIVQFIAMACKSIRSNKASALLLIFSSIVWSIVAAKFVSSANTVVTTAPWVYGTWAFVTALAGYELLTVNKKLEGKRNGAV